MGDGVLTRFVNQTIKASFLLVEALPLRMNLTRVVNPAANGNRQRLARPKTSDLDDVCEYSAGGASCLSQLS